jgi:hypothetical protein
MDKKSRTILILFVLLIILFFITHKRIDKHYSKELTEVIDGTTEWNLESPLVNKNLAGQENSSLILTIKGIYITGYYVTEFGRSKLTGTIQNNLVKINIPEAATGTGVKLKGELIDNFEIVGTRELYIQTTMQQSADDIKAFKAGNQIEQFRATRK